MSLKPTYQSVGSPNLTTPAPISDDRLKLKKVNSDPHWTSMTSRDQFYEFINRPWEKDETNTSQNEHSTRGLTPMERWQKESTREQPYHNLDSIVKAGKGRSTASTEHVKHICKRSRIYGCDISGMKKIDNWSFMAGM